MAANRIPLAVMVPYYWHAYGPQNFLYFCDVAVLVTLVGLWTESRFLLSLEAVAILLPQVVWLADFAVGLTGHPLIHMTDYMHDPSLPLFVRGLSLFHGWMPILLLGCLARVGYDRRAFPAQVVVGITLLLVCYLGFAPPGQVGGHQMHVNINYVYGLDENHAQTALPPLAWLGVLVVAIPTVMYLPAHLLLNWWFGSGRSDGTAHEEAPHVHAGLQGA
jgi:hypothetical protein